MNVIGKPTKLKTYHYSANFNNTDMNYHGEFETASVNQSVIISNAKQSLTQKIPEWGVSPTNLKSFEIYTIEDNQEKQIFIYPK
jgi:hypothetical protein